MSAGDKQRFTRNYPCPICGGHDRLTRGQGRRCYGFMSSDGLYAHCTREDLAGAINKSEGSKTFGHILRGSCKCGTQHSPDRAEYGNLLSFNTNGNTPKSGNVGIAVQRAEDVELTDHDITEYYDYLNQDHVTKFRVVRYENPAYGKTFRQWQPNHSGGWVKNLKGVETFPYKLVELVTTPKTETVFIVEGEKDVETLSALGYTATCNPMGAEKWKESYNKYFSERHVIILPDNDEAGKRHAKQVLTHLKTVASSIKIVELPGLKEHGDISDWVYSGHTSDELIKVIGITEYAYEVPQEEKTCFHISELHLIPPVRWLLKPFLQDCSINLISGESGSGKTFIALGWSLELARTMNVLYIAAEDPTQFPERIDGWCTYHRTRNLNFWLETAPFHLLQPDTVSAILKRHEDKKPRIVVIDTYHAATEGANENDNGQIGLVLGQLRRFVKEWQACVLVVHHFDKAGNNERGGSSLRAGVMQALRLYTEGDGARLSFDKVRNTAKSEDQYFKFELVDVNVTVGDEIETRSIRVAATSEMPAFDKKKLSNAQLHTLKWMGEEHRRAELHNNKDIQLGTQLSERTANDVLYKLKYLKLIEQPKSKGPYKITESGLQSAGYLNRGELSF